MNNCIILGSGRSGTSMVAGAMAKAGYFMGDRILPPLKGNPKGFFEDHEINSINEKLLAQVMPKKPWIVGRWFFKDRPGQNQRWLARIPLDIAIPECPTVIKRIKKILQKTPFCFKDPRFSYTLPVWRPFLKNTVFVCVFRDPSITGASILTECKERPYLRSLKITFSDAMELWTLMYSHILQHHSQEGEWIFLHYNQILFEDGLNRLERFTAAAVDQSFPEPSLQRSVSSMPVPKKTMGLYNQLCGLSGYPCR